MWRNDAARVTRWRRAADDAGEQAVAIRLDKRMTVAITRSQIFADELYILVSTHGRRANLCHDKFAD
jgi:hypothetical protein